MPVCVGLWRSILRTYVWLLFYTGGTNYVLCYSVCIYVYMYICMYECKYIYIVLIQAHYETLRNIVT